MTLLTPDVANSTEPMGLEHLLLEQDRTAMVTYKISTHTQGAHDKPKLLVETQHRGCLE